MIPEHRTGRRTFCRALQPPLLALLLWSGGPAVAAEEAGTPHGLPEVRCLAEQTGGFHDYPGGEERYEPALFHPQSFSLEENLVLMMNLAAEERNVDLYLTMTRTLSGGDSGDDDVPVLETTELECRQVRGALGGHGYSCVNVPPSEMLLINAQTLRFTRTSVGGWSFSGATEAHNGDSIFGEYGLCEPAGE